MSDPSQRRDECPGVFATTRWSLVLAVQDEGSPGAQEALAQLCRTYWFPLYSYVRRQGHDVADAQDFTQEFFARLLAGNDLMRAGPDQGRFRSFLLIRLKHFLINEWEKARTQKRGGGQQMIPLDELQAEERFLAQPSDAWSPEHSYERQWALTLLDQVLARLRREWEEAGKSIQFEALKRLLAREQLTESYAVLGHRLGLSEGAVKITVYRLRQRYRELIRDEIAQTVATPGEIDDELRQLLAALTAA